VPAANEGRMGGSAILGVLGDVRGSIASFVDVFITVYILLILVYVLSSWIRLPYNPWLNRIQRFLYDVCEPYLRLFRRVLPPLGPIDLSPVVAIIVLVVIQRVVVGVLD
jgi:YggT family protein